MEKKDRKSYAPPGVTSTRYELWNQTINQEIQKALLREDYAWVAFLRGMRLP
jgi:hypothetical protein